MASPGECRVKCTGCGAVTLFPLDGEQAGRHVTCPACGTQLPFPPRPGVQVVEPVGGQDTGDGPPASSKGIKLLLVCDGCQMRIDATGIEQGRKLMCPRCEMLVTVPRTGPIVLRRSGSHKGMPAVAAGSTGPQPADESGGHRTYIGQTVLGCRLESILRQTPTTLLFKARHLKLDRAVAVKVLKAHIAGNRLTVERFLNEARIASRIDHAGLVAIHDVGEDTEQQLCAIVMEYVEGLTLAEQVRTSGLLAPREAVELLIQACGALAVAHAADIIHRDIKPDNLLRTPDGLLKITDFGLALDETAQRMTLAGQTVGTPHYMSPEQCQGQPLDRRSDLYSLGLVGYYCVTGTEPMLGETDIATMYRQTNHVPPPLNQLLPAITPELARVIGQMIAKSIEQRPATAEAAAQALRAAIDDGQRSSSRQAIRQSSHRRSAVPAAPPQGSSTRRAAASASTARQVAVARQSSATRPVVNRGSSGLRAAQRRSSSRLNAAPGASRKWLGLSLVAVAGVALLGFLLHRGKLARSAREEGAPATSLRRYEAALQQGDRKQAFLELTGYLERHPQDWKARRQRIQLARDLSQLDQAVGDLELLARMGQITGEETDDLVFLYHQRKQYDPAKVLIGRIAARDQARARRLALQLASYLEQDRQYGPALDVLGQLPGARKDPGVLQQMARLHILAEQVLEAGQALLPVIRAGTDDPDPERTRQMVRDLRPLLTRRLGPRLAAGKLAPAEAKLLDELREQDPSFYLHWFAHARELLGRGDAAGAATAIGRAVESSEGIPTATINQAMADLALQAGNPRAAARAVLNVDPRQDKQPGRTRELLRKLRRRYADLAKDGQRVLAELAARDPQFYGYQFHAGLARLSANDAAGALAHFNKALALLDHSAESQTRIKPLIYLSRAQCQLALKNHRAALADSRWCLDHPLTMNLTLNALLLRFQAQLGLSQTDRARRTATVAGWLLQENAPTLAAMRKQLQASTGRDKPASDEEADRSYAVDRLVAHAADPLRRGDRITACAGRPIRDGKALAAAIRQLKDGKLDSLALLVKRAGGEIETVRLPRKFDGSKLPVVLHLRILDKDE